MKLLLLGVMSKSVRASSATRDVKSGRNKATCISKELVKTSGLAMQAMSIGRPTELTGRAGFHPCTPYLTREKESGVGCVMALPESSECLVNDPGCLEMVTNQKEKRQSRYNENFVDQYESRIEYLFLWL
jgi:hypothetical protein